MENLKMKKNLLTTLLLLALVMTLIACGSDEKTNTNVETSTDNQTQADAADEIVADDNTAMAENNTTDEESTTDTNTENQEVTEPDEPITEMVSWEEWATQADHDEVCMVVWNEKTGTQEILKPMSENTSIYTVQEGDRFAVPRRDIVSYVAIGFETDIYWQSEEQKYIEFELPIEEMKQVYIVCNDREKAITYLFNY